MANFDTSKVLAEVVKQVEFETGQSWNTAEGRPNTSFQEAVAKELVERVVDSAVNVCLAERNPGNLNYKPSEKFADAIKRFFGKY